MKHAAMDVRSAAFATHFGTALQQVRGARRLRHFAHLPFSRRDLRAAERGQLPLDAPTVNALASRYGLDLSTVFADRHQLSIEDSMLCVGTNEEAFPAGDTSAMFDAYLRLVRRARGLAGHEAIVLRSNDMEILAEASGRSQVHVLNELGKRMGIARLDRIAMADMMVAGSAVAGVLEPAGS